MCNRLVGDIVIKKKGASDFSPRGSTDGIGKVSMLKINIKTKIVSGFICVIFLMVLISWLGWYLVNSLKYAKDTLKTGYKIKNAILECRRQEKNLLLRGPAGRHLALWEKSFIELKDIDTDAEKQGYISLRESEILNNALTAYKTSFESFFRELKEKGAFSNGSTNYYDEQFTNSSKIVIALSEKIIENAAFTEHKLEGITRFVFSYLPVLGILIMAFLGTIILRNAEKSFKKINALDKELEDNYLEFALGLSEHFEVLRRVSNGDLKIRTSENYQSELLAKLGQVINQTIQRLFDASKREFEKTFFVSPSGMRVVDNNFNIIRTNQAMAELSGLSKEEILSRKCYEQFKGPYCYTDQCTLKQILAGIGRVQKEMDRQREDGSKIYCLLNAVPLYDWEGNVIGMVQDFADLTRFKEAETEVELYSMQMALGISEIFETLNQFSRGDFKARVRKDLGNELLNKLSMMVNDTIINFGQSWEILESSKLYSENIINSITDVVIVVDKDAKIKSFNAATKDLLEYTKEELLGESVEQFFKKGDKSFSFHGMLKLIGGYDLNNYEAFLVSKYGKKIPVLFNYSAVKDKEGTIVYIVCTAKDITELKQTEYMLAASEKKYKAIIETSNDLIWMLDKNGNFTFLNKKAEIVSGYRQEDLLGLNFEPLLLPAELEKARRILHEAAIGKHSRYELRFYKKDGTICVLSINTAPIYSESKDEVTGIISFGQDVTIAKQMETKLHVTEERYRSLIEMSPDLVGLLDLDLNIIMINNVGVSYYGYDKENEILGRNIQEFLVREDFLKAMESRERLLKTGVIRNEQFVLKRKDGSLVSVEVNANMVNDEEKNLKYIIIIARDITGRKQAENELKGAYEELQRVHLQLVQTEKMAAIGRLAGGVAHEINNPLTGVLNNVQLIRMMSSEKKELSLGDFKELLEVIEDSALRCKKITESLIGFSHSQTMDFNELSLNAIIEKSIVVMGEDLKQQNIFLKNELQPGLPNIKGNRALLEQVAANLISNAKWAVEKKFKKSEGGIITVKTEYVLDAALVNLYIADNGIGIPEEKISKVFDPFFTTKQIGEGMGLGLPLVYYVIKHHNGMISVDSKLNEGSIFKISLPAAS